MTAKAADPETAAGTLLKDPCVAAIDRAIREKMVLSFRYGDSDRIACPYLLGVASDGRVVLHAWQIGGFSHGVPVTRPEWRFFYLSEIRSGVEEVGHVAWQQAPLAKSSTEYKPPPFIKRVLSIHGS